MLCRRRSPTPCLPCRRSSLAALDLGDAGRLGGPDLPEMHVRTFGVFKNQGDCVSFVATNGKNPPADP